MREDTDGRDYRSLGRFLLYIISISISISITTTTTTTTTTPACVGGLGVYAAALGGGVHHGEVVVTAPVGSGHHGEVVVVVVPSPPVAWGTKKTCREWRPAPLFPEGT